MSKPKGFRYSERERDELLSLYRQSGYGVTRFCKETGVSYGTMRRWLEDSGSSAGPNAGASLVEVALESGSEEEWLSVRLPNGIVAQARLGAEKAEVIGWIRELSRC